MNAIGAVTRTQLADAIKQAERDDAVRVVVLTGSGRAFCSGADVTEMAPGAGMRTPEDVGNVLRNEYMPMLMRLRTMPKPVIAVINRIVPAERLEDEVRDLANQLASQPRQAVAAAKRAVIHALTSTYEEAMEFESYLQEAQAASPEFAEGVQNFLARRAKK